jgi:CRP-like cAMP-binding protein
MLSPEIAAEVRNLNPRLFEGLQTAAFDEVFAVAKERHYPANSVMTHEGHPANYLFLILSGRARFFSITPDGNKVVVSWLPPGDIFGGAVAAS